MHDYDYCGAGHEQNPCTVANGVILKYYIKGYLFMIFGPSPFVSIIVCTYNRSRQLRKTLESLLKLEYTPYEIIVVDNNSKDDTPQVVAEYPVRYVFEGQPGVAFARNMGLETAKGEYVGFIDDDERVAPQWIQGMLQGFQLHPQVAAVTGPCIPEYEVPLPFWLKDDINAVPADEKYKGLFLLSHREVLGTGNALFDKKKLSGIRFKTQLGRKQGGIIGGEDSDFIYQLYAKGYKAAYSPEALVYHWIPAERLTLRYFMRRYFCEGITEYLRKGNGVVWRRLYKPVPDCIALLLAIISFHPKRITGRWLRLCQTLGILYGPIYSHRHKDS